MLNPEEIAEVIPEDVNAEIALAAAERGFERGVEHVKRQAPKVAKKIVKGVVDYGPGAIDAAATGLEKMGEAGLETAKVAGKLGWKGLKLLGKGARKMMRGKKKNEDIADIADSISEDLTILDPEMKAQIKDYIDDRMEFYGGQLYVHKLTAALRDAGINMSWDDVDGMLRGFGIIPTGRMGYYKYATEAELQDVEDRERAERELKGMVADPRGHLKSAKARQAYVDRYLQHSREREEAQREKFWQGVGEDLDTRELAKMIPEDPYSESYESPGEGRWQCPKCKSEQAKFTPKGMKCLKCGNVSEGVEPDEDEDEGDEEEEGRVKPLVRGSTITKGVEKVGEKWGKLKEFLKAEEANMDPKEIARMISEDLDIPGVSEDGAIVEGLLREFVEKLKDPNITTEELDRAIQLLTEGWLSRSLAGALMLAVSILGGCAEKAAQTGDPELQAKINTATNALEVAIDYVDNATPDEQERDTASRALADKGVVNKYLDDARAARAQEAGGEEDY
jgi:hypothetical protein